jgi:phosphatidate cytidylyltransferase
MQPRSELGRRVGAGVAAALVALAALAIGGLAWWLLAAALALVGLAEWGRLVGAERSRFVLSALVLGVALVAAAPTAWGPDRSTTALLLILSLLLMLLPRSAGAAWGAAYLGTAAIALLFLRDQPDGFALTLWTLLVVWATDIGAFFAGRRIGGAKLAPRLSPNKTWAGLGGGMAAALLVGGVVAMLTGLPRPALWLGAPLAVVAQAGDLFESALKRRAGVKDSGAVLPGHGGVLDRVDGLLPVAILVAALLANGSF